MKKKIAALLTTLLVSGNIYVAKAGTITNYTVKSGDSLWLISNNFKTTVSSIASLNNINANGYIYIGQTLKIDDNKNTYHTVSSGDTLWRLSVNYNTTADAIMKENNLTTSIIYIGQVLRIPSTISLPAPTPTPTQSTVKTSNYTVVSGDTVWGVSQKFNTSVDAIVKSNMLALPIFMPGQIVTVPVNSTEIVKPVGITMMRAKSSDKFGDLYTWTNARRIFTVGQTGTLKDLNTGIIFNIKYYGGSNHSDIVPLTVTDSNKMRQIYPTWSWSAIRPMILTFNQGGTNYQLAVSVTGMPHSSTDSYAQNGINGHFDMYFYNSTSHVADKISPTHQKNILTANGQ